MASPAELAAFQNFPLQPPPPGQTSNFNNPESRGPAIITVCSVFVGIMWPILVLRLYSKVWVIRSFGWDDGKPKVSLTFFLLTCKQPAPSLPRFAGLFLVVQGGSIDQRQIGATSFTAGVIWCTNFGFFGPHGWSVRASVFTPKLVKVSIYKNPKLISD